MVTIYCLFDIRDRIPRYIGTTNQVLLNDRLQQHLTGSIKKTTKKDRWIQSVGKENIGIRYVSECQPTERLQAEKEYIQLYSEFNLVNTIHLEPAEGSLGEYIKQHQKR